MTTAHRPVDPSTLRVEPLIDAIALEGFSCGEAEIDRNIPKCCEWHAIYSRRVFCAFLPDEKTACGFYCIGISASESKYLDQKLVRASGGKNYVPFIYLHYLAVSRDLQNNRVGTILLMHALARCSLVIKNIGIHGVALHALNDRAAGLYDRYGFREYSKSRYPFMVLPALSVLDLFP